MLHPKGNLTPRTFSNKVGVCLRHVYYHNVERVRITIPSKGMWALCVNLLMWMPIFEWYTARFVVKNGHQKKQHVLQ